MKASSLMPLPEISHFRRGKLYHSAKWNFQWVWRQNHLFCLTKVRVRRVWNHSQKAIEWDTVGILTIVDCPRDLIRSKGGMQIQSHRQCIVKPHCWVWDGRKRGILPAEVSLVDHCELWARGATITNRLSSHTITWYSIKLRSLSATWRWPCRGWLLSAIII